MWNATQSLRNVPERDVHAFWLQNQVEFIWLGLDAAHLILGQVHQSVHFLLEAFSAVCTPLQPQLEDVIVSTALDDLVAGIVADVV